jgi:hypothetical protein
MLIITHRSRQHHSQHRTPQPASQQANITASTAHRRQHRSRQYRSQHRTPQTASQQAISQPAPHTADSIAAGKHHSQHRTPQTASQQAISQPAPHTADSIAAGKHHSSTAHRRQSSLTTLPPLVTPVPFNPFMAAGKIIFWRSVNLIFDHSPRDKTSQIPGFFDA